MAKYGFNPGTGHAVPSGPTPPERTGRPSAIARPHCRIIAGRRGEVDQK